MSKHYELIIRKPREAAKRLEQLEEEVEGLRYERAEAGKRAMKAEAENKVHSNTITELEAKLANQAKTISDYQKAARLEAEDD